MGLLGGHKDRASSAGQPKPNQAQGTSGTKLGQGSPVMDRGEGRSEYWSR